MHVLKNTYLVHPIMCVLKQEYSLDGVHCMYVLYTCSGISVMQLFKF